MLGKIFIKNLIVQAHVGAHIHERNLPQNIVLNIAVWADVSTSIVSEKLADTVDYHTIQNEVIERLQKNQYVLIETVANDIIELCFKDARIQKVFVSVEKPHKLPNSDSVGVEIEKSR